MVLEIGNSSFDQGECVFGSICNELVLFDEGESLLKGKWLGLSYDCFDEPALQDIAYQISYRRLRHS